MNKIYVFRHGKTIFNEHHYFCGHTDVDINEEGVEQAKKLGEKLKSKKIEIAFSSPLKRAKQTMEHALKYHPKVFYCIEPRIIERNYGWLQKQSKDRWAVNSYRIFKIFHRSYFIPPPGGESLRQVRKRTEDFCVELVDLVKKIKKNVAVCGHSNSVRGIRTYFENLDRHQMVKIETKVGQLFEYDV
jgi:broad specificity phosphatase PhoE